MDKMPGARKLKEGYSFRVWAPNANEVYLAGTFNKFSPEATPMQQKDGYWEVTVPGAKEGDEYKYRLVTEKGELYRKDPYSKVITDKTNNSVLAPGGGEKKSGFKMPDINELVIYELHIGTFLKESLKKEPGTFDSALKKLEYLKALGINCIEIMPVAEFAGDYSWGYNPSNIFAIETAYGTKDEFHKLIEKAHSMGIAVLVDVVYNHLGPGDLDLWQFDGWSENGKGGIYFYNDWRSKTPWGETRPDYGRKEVREYLRDNALFWFREYNIDGLRWDATNFIRNAEGLNDGGEKDIPEGWSLMSWINDEVHKEFPFAVMIAEDMQDNAFITKGTKDGGAGFDAQWDSRFVQAVRKTLISAEDEQRDLTLIKDSLMHRYYLDAFERVIYTESHDEVANGKARVPEEVQPGKASNYFARKKSALGGAMVLTSPGVPMIFQGQEFLEDDWFHDEDPLDWSKASKFSGILDLYKALIKLRLNKEGQTRGLCGQNIEVVHLNDQDNMICFHRWEEKKPGDSVMVIVNFSAEAYLEYRTGFPLEGKWKVMFNSDDKKYDDTFSGVSTQDIRTVREEADGRDFSANVSIGPYSAVIFSYQGT
jgi:1,4-alpha-glucan branching enzyme